MRLLAPPPLLLLLLGAAAAGALTVPDWTWEPAPAQVFQHCLALPNVTGDWYNETITWTNNSRMLSIAVPKGAPPPGGWPVMIDLLVIDYPSLYGQPMCGLDGNSNPATRDYPASKKCQALGKQLCGDKLNATHFQCTGCFSKNRTELLTVCEHEEVYTLEKQCRPEPPLMPLNKSCTEALVDHCNWTFSIPDDSKGQRFRHHNCTLCVAKAQLNLSTHAGSECPQVNGAPHSAAWNQSVEFARYDMEQQFCDRGKSKHGGAGGVRVPHVRAFAPFVSPQHLAMGCSCINGSDPTKFRCLPPYDDDQHGHPFVPPGGFCSFDVFAGGLWSQRFKQYLLNNGIAIVEANNYVDDGWESWDDEWEGGYDAMFFKQLAAAMRAGGSADGRWYSSPHGTDSSDGGGGGGALAALSSLNPSRVAFRGWSGSAQMVSWLINQDARGKLPGLKVKAGIMMAGGSHACYNWPGHGAKKTVFFHILSKNDHFTKTGSGQT